jgi:protein SCO1/2
MTGCGNASHRSATQVAAARSSALDAPGSLSPVRLAAPLRLKNSLGNPVDLRLDRGKAVFVTFVYTHCPDVCPLIMGNLHNALALLGPKAAQVRLIAVSTDPVGDTPKTVKPFLRKHELTGHIDYLIGSRPQLRKVWKAWGIAAKASSSNPEQVEHSALIYGITASGKLTALYPSNFKPEWIAHDAPLLASR